MSLPVYVQSSSGYKANERPRQFELDESFKKLLPSRTNGIRRKRYSSKVRTTDGKRYLLRYDERTDEWTLQSRFDGDELLARPGIELVSVDAETIRKAEARIESSEQCHPDDAEIPLDWALAT